MTDTAMITNRPNDPRLLRLHAADNVVTVIAPLAAGERS